MLHCPPCDPSSSPNQPRFLFFNILTQTCLFSVGEDGTPTIRPLETLHNALSLCQVDSFLHHVTTANFKTPGSSPRWIKKHSNHDHLFETLGCFRPLRRAVSCLENRPDKRSRIGGRNQTNCLPPLMWTSACAVKPTVMKYTLKYRLQHHFKWPCVLPVSGNKASAEVKGKQLGWQ